MVRDSGVAKASATKQILQPPLHGEVKFVSLHSALNDLPNEGLCRPCPGSHSLATSVELRLWPP